MLRACLATFSTLALGSTGIPGPRIEDKEGQRALMLDKLGFAENERNASLLQGTHVSDSESQVLIPLLVQTAITTGLETVYSLSPILPAKIHT